MCPPREGAPSSDHTGTLSPLRSPEPSKTSALASSEDGIEPVSPPEGMAEPGHPRSAMYPPLYRDGEQVEPRYLMAAPATMEARDPAPCPPEGLCWRLGAGHICCCTRVSEPCAGPSWGSGRGRGRAPARPAGLRERHGLNQFWLPRPFSGVCGREGCCR